MTVTFRAADHSYTTEKGEQLVPVTRVLEEFGFLDTRWYTEAARDRGTAVHEAIKLIATGVLSIDDYRHTEIVGYLHAYNRFIRQTGYIVNYVEHPVWHDVMRYAGTGDAVGALKGFNTLVDFKTGASEFWHGLQGAAYRLAWNERYPDAPIQRFRVVQLRDDGNYRVRDRYKNRSYDDRYWTSGWKAIMTVYWMRHRTGRTV